MTLAARDSEIGRKTASLFHFQAFRVYTSADMVGVQLHKATAYHLGGLIVPGNTQRLVVGGAGVHQQIYNLIDGILIVRAKPEQKVYLQRLRKYLRQL